MGSAGSVILIILGIALIAILWISGGSLIQQPLIPSVVETGSQTSDEKISETGKTQETKIVRIYGSNARADDPENEYIEIQADNSNTAPVNITGWKLQNRKGNVFLIPTGSALPYSGRINTQENIVLKPGEKAIILTGKSPINTSFRPNLCTGYFNRIYQFNPRLPEKCPDPDEEKGADAQDDACFLYLKTLPVCQTPAPSDIPAEADFKCREFIDERLSYAACVEGHKNDEEFFSGEWRVYLQKTQEIWSDVRETIKLFDLNSNLVAETSI
ncbi:MAG: lamin tail domain-containing protein [Candidatus Niyogibacteria bacterium]|nr:lamin tail domain-containing protein [Candidatus Niyogibacteria bacterium]